MSTSVPAPAAGPRDTGQTSDVLDPLAPRTVQRLVLDPLATPDPAGGMVAELRF